MKRTKVQQKAIDVVMAKLKNECDLARQKTENLLIEYRKSQKEFEAKQEACYVFWRDYERKEPQRIFKHY